MHSKKNAACILVVLAPCYLVLDAACSVVYYVSSQCSHLPALLLKWMHCKQLIKHIKFKCINPKWMHCKYTARTDCAFTIHLIYSICVHTTMTWTNFVYMKQQLIKHFKCISKCTSDFEKKVPKCMHLERYNYISDSFKRNLSWAKNEAAFTKFSWNC